MAQSNYSLLAFVILIIFYCRKLIRNYQARQVRLGPVLKRNAGSYEQQAHKLFAEQHGCLPPPRIQNQRPWGVDRLEQIFRGDRESRLMELFMFHFRQTGNTIEQVFIGTTAFDTIEPANLEAMLSTKFKGMLTTNTQLRHCFLSHLTLNRLRHGSTSRHHVSHVW
jgi:hypothetical protein